MVFNAPYFEKEHGDSCLLYGINNKNKAKNAKAGAAEVII